MSNTIQDTVTEIFNLYKEYGHNDYIGEPVSQLEHMSQAAQLAIKEGHDDEVVLAAFFHDIGHICAENTTHNDMGGYGIVSHEKIGAAFLRKKGFPESVARLVENHVEAKRYLTYKYPSYYESLSEASKQTLEFQGGKMKPEEALSFERNPLFRLSISLRRWDELAKRIDVPLINVEELQQRAVRVLRKKAELIED